VVGGGAGQGGVWGGGPAVVGEGTEQRIDVEQVRLVVAAAAARVADQVVAGGGEAAPEVGSWMGTVPGQDRVAQVQGAGVADAAAPSPSFIPGDGAVADRQRAPLVVVDAAAVQDISVPGDVAVADRQRASVVDAAAGIGRARTVGYTSVPGDSAVADR